MLECMCLAWCNSKAHMYLLCAKHTFAYSWVWLQFTQVLGLVFWFAWFLFPRISACAGGESAPRCYWVRKAEQTQVIGFQYPAEYLWVCFEYALSVSTTFSMLWVYSVCENNIQYAVCFEYTVCEYNIQYALSTCCLWIDRSGSTKMVKDLDLYGCF